MAVTNKFLNPAINGAVLSIFDVSGYKISKPKHPGENPGYGNRGLVERSRL
jgi:phosphoketolase